MYSKQFIESLAEFICGDDSLLYPICRNSSALTSFFQNINIDVVHDGTTRKNWVWLVLDNLTFEEIERVIKILVSLESYKAKQKQIGLAIDSMKKLLLCENKTIEFIGIEPNIIECNTTMEDILNDINTTTQEKQVSQNFSPNTIVNDNGNTVNITYNISSQDNKLFEDLIAITNNIENDSEILKAISEMKETIKTPNFKEKYKNFMSVISDHITIFTPVLVGLSQLL